MKTFSEGDIILLKESSLLVNTNTVCFVYKEECGDTFNGTTLYYIVTEWGEDLQYIDNIEANKYCIFLAHHDKYKYYNHPDHEHSISIGYYREICENLGIPNFTFRQKYKYSMDTDFIIHKYITAEEDDNS